MEIRHHSFVEKSFVALLRKYRVALVVADTAGKWPYLEEVTSDFMYLRLHGEEELYASGYTEVALNRWAKRIREWSEGKEPKDVKHISNVSPSQRASRDVYCYFDNDVKVRAPFDAKRLIEKLGLADGLVPFRWSGDPEPDKPRPSAAYRVTKRKQKTIDLASAMKKTRAE